MGARMWVSRWIEGTGQLCRVCHALADDQSLQLSARSVVQDAQGATVRTLVSGTQVRGPQSVPWAGSTDARRPVHQGSYTLQSQATDARSFTGTSNATV